MPPARDVVDMKADSSLFDELHVWYDPVARSGGENMAVDEWLLANHTGKPILRFYDWSTPTVSFGYFEKLADVSALFPLSLGVSYVRRLTGGGIVDHRHDQTYSLIIPRSHPLAMARAADSYCHIHKALSAFLEGSLTYSNPIHAGKRSTNRSSRACFQNPVEHDVLDSVGEKIAGAGQRRTKLGMLHQGSVITLKNIKHGFDYLLAKHAMKKDFSPDTTEYIEKYLDQKWIERR